MLRPIRPGWMKTPQRGNPPWRSYGGRACWGCLFFASFLWASKERKAPGRARPAKVAIAPGQRPLLRPPPTMKCSSRTPAQQQSPQSNNGKDRPGIEGQGRAEGRPERPGDDAGGEQGDPADEVEDPEGGAAQLRRGGESEAEVGGEEKDDPPGEEGAATAVVGEVAEGVGAGGVDDVHDNENQR